MISLRDRPGGNFVNPWQDSRLILTGSIGIVNVPGEFAGKVDKKFTNPCSERMKYGTINMICQGRSALSVNLIQSKQGGICLDFKNSTFMFILGGIVGVFVIAQSLFFLIRAYRRGKARGMKTGVLKKTVLSSSVFAIVPSVSILLGVITLSSALGLPLPWIRLSVLGAVTYEIPAATAAAGALGQSISSPIADPTTFNAVAWVMTLGCITPIIIIPLFLKKIQGGISKIQKKDSRWGELFLTALFLGMISAFLGMGIGDGLLSILTLLSSALIMGVCGLLIKKAKWAWLENFALPISMLGAMALAVLYANVLPADLLPADLLKTLVEGGIR